MSGATVRQYLRNNEYVYSRVREWSMVGFVVFLLIAVVTQVYFMTTPA